MKKENKKTNTIAAESDVMIVTDDGCVSPATQDSNWVIDYDASFDVTSHSDFFTSYKTGDFDNVRMGNSGVSKIVGIRDISLETGIGNKLALKDRVLKSALKAVLGSRHNHSLVIEPCLPRHALYRRGAPYRL